MVDYQACLAVEGSEVAIVDAPLFRSPEADLDGTRWVPHGRSRFACVAQVGGPAEPCHQRSAQTWYEPYLAA